MAISQILRLVVLLLVTTAACAGQSRLVQLTGASGFDRGVSLGTLVGPSIAALFQHKLSVYSKIPGALATWNSGTGQSRQDRRHSGVQGLGR